MKHRHFSSSKARPWFALLHEFIEKIGSFQRYWAISYHFRKPFMNDAIDLTPVISLKIILTSLFILLLIVMILLYYSLFHCFYLKWEVHSLVELQLL